jgi:hypothetical protein
MALFDKENQKLFIGLVVGAAAGSLATKFAPLLAETAKPALKTAVKIALLGAEATREFAAHAKEAIEDATAEAQSELRKPAPSAVAPAAVANDFAVASARKGVGSA